MVLQMRNIDDLHPQFAHCKTHVGSIATCSRDFSMDDTGERIETPICRDAGKHFRDEGQLTRVPSECIF